MQKTFLKIIAGIENRNLSKVLNLVEAALYCNVQAIDICDEPEIIKAVKEQLIGSQTKLFVSSLSYESLKLAASLGADYLEIGNYDHLHAQKIEFPVSQITNIANQLLEDGFTNLSVTVPGNLSVNDQACLAQDLHSKGVSIIQIEGGSISIPESSGAIGHIEKAKITLANTIELKNAVPEARIMAAGGLSSSTVALALAAGADGIGIGSAVSKLSSQIEMIAAIKNIQEKMQAFQKITALQSV